MPSSSFPPTPAASGGFTMKESSFHAMDTMAEQSFALPPAALSPIAPDSSNALSSSRKGSVVTQSPISPASSGISANMESKSSTNIAARVGTKRAAAATTAVSSSSTALDEFNLPPPPTRSRKIIQMKPKTVSAASSSNTSSATTKPSQQKKTAPKSGSASVSKNSTLATVPSATTMNATSTQLQQPNSGNGSKKKQPSATSAAGRKIARKTAHSLIERRRRSKMNEEFSTLKNMIPACRGQEMHKLAILQASIDYMNYLEECITELKNNATSGSSKKLKLEAPPLAPPSPTSPELLIPTMVGSEESAGSESEPAASPELRPHNNNYNNNYNNNSSSSTHPSTMTTTTTTTAAYYSSPSFSPYTVPTMPQQSIQPLESGNHPILPSPALRPLYSPQLPPQTQSDAQQNRSSWRVQSQILSATPSPAILPQQHRQSISAVSAASPMFLANDSLVDHEASAALLMLNMDRRGPSSISEGSGTAAVSAGGMMGDEGSSSSSTPISTSNERKIGMSVRDLLTS